MRTIKRFLLSLLGISLALNLSFGQASFLDNTFHEDGVAFFVQPNGQAYPRAVAILPGDDILVAGMATLPDGKTDMLLLRYHADGTLDDSFGTGGVVQFDWNGHNDFARALAVQPDGKILVGGGTLITPSFHNGILCRFLPDGTLDTDFGDNGIVISDVRISIYQTMKLFLLPDGRITWCFNGVPYDSWMGRYHTDGSLDTTFGDGGISLFEPLIGWDIEYPSWVMLPDSRIVMVGRLEYNNNYFSIFLRFDANATTREIELQGDRNDTTQDALLTDEGIITVGRHGNNSVDGAAITRIGLEGDTDSSFLAIGHLPCDSEVTWTYFRAVALQANGKLVAVGYVEFIGDTTGHCIIERFKENGEMDEAFGIGSCIKLNFSPDFNIGNAVAIDAHDRIIVAGASGDLLMVARILGDGVSGLASPSAAPFAFHLRPNPVGQAFSIEYNLPAASACSLVLYDLLGQPIHVFYENQLRQASPSTESFELPSALPNGPYLLRFRTDQGEHLQKIILMR